MKKLKFIGWFSALVLIVNSCDLVDDEIEITPKEVTLKKGMPHLESQVSLETPTGLSNEVSANESQAFFSNIGFGSSE